MWFILRKKCTHFVANSVHFLSHVHSGKSVIQLCEQNKLSKISQLSVKSQTLVDTSQWVPPQCWQQRHQFIQRSCRGWRGYCCSGSVFVIEIITSAFANTKNAPSVELHLHEEDIKQDASTRNLWFYVEALSIRFFDNFCKQSIKTF